MQRRPLHHCAAQLYRLQISHRRHNTRSANLIRDLLELRQLPLCRELIRNRPAWCLGRITQLFLLP